MKIDDRKTIIFRYNRASNQFQILDVIDGIGYLLKAV